MSYQVPATQHGFRQSSRMLMLTFEISELNNPDVAKIALHGETYGWLNFTENQKDIENIELPKLPKSGKKTDSQLLRNVLFLYWQQAGGEGSSEDFYHKEMNKIIEHYKTKFDR